ncbi:MAG: T9SS type A sorting domain-containing protein [Bacteroidia bacterium]|nr:T9SS type A sorting domain-containing protein [Bacteroidia bacterium]
MKSKYLLTLVLILTNLLVNAQVWYPEGVFLGTEPSLMTIDNQVITIGRSHVDASNSYWVVSISDGTTWSKLPTLVLNKTAELTDIKKYQGMVYVSGNFTYDNGKYNALVRYNGVNWQGLGVFNKLNQTNASISSMVNYQGLLLLGGGFQLVDADTMPYLIKFNGLKFSKYFDCLNCDPDYSVNDLALSDSVLAISGLFSKINNQSSKYIYSVYTDGSTDTFVNTPRVLDKLAAIGRTVYAVGGVLKDKSLFEFKSGSLTEINANIDSITVINEILEYDGKLVICGNYSLVSNTDLKNRITVRTENGNWFEITNNNTSPTFIASGRTFLFALGNSKKSISIWNPNRFVLRFYPGLSLVRAKAFIDSNNNCIWDSTEKPAPKQYIKLPFINKGVFTNEDGLTEFFVPNASTNTYRFVVKPFRSFIRSNCADTSVSKTFSSGQYFDSIQFPLKRVPNINDIRVSISSPKGKLVLKNKKVIYYITYENVGSNAIEGKIRLRKSKYFSSEVCLPTQTVINDSIFEWNYTNLQPGERKVILYSGLPVSAEFDNSFQFDAAVASSITSGASDFNDDDFDSIPQEVNSSISAFRKDVFPTPALGDSITYLSVEDRDLRYNIAFNNFGTDTVFYAVVIDTLDLNLDMSYIQETGSNKSYYTEVQTDPNNDYKGIIIWHFPNIKLAPNPSKDYENQNSGAYIGFKVNTKPLSKGYVLKNTASVYYDNTYAGSTNSVYCTLQLTDLEKIEFEKSFKMYPNPVNNLLHLNGQFIPGTEIKIYDMNGRLLQALSVNDYTDIIDIECSDWSAGLYMVRIDINGFSHSELLQIAR